MSQPGMISHGLPPRDNDVQRDIAELRRRIQQMHGMIVQAITGRGGITIEGGGALVVKDASSDTLLNVGQFYSDYLSHLVGQVLVQGMQQLTPTGVLIFETWYDPNYAANGWFQVGSPYASNRPNFGVYSNQVNIEAVTSAMMSCSNESITISDSQGVLMQSGSAGYTLVGVGTSAASANLALNSSTGVLTRSTSSRRYKRDITDADLDPETLLQLEPRRFRSKAEVEEQGDAAPEHVGFIAEEAADLGLDEFVTCDDEGPEAFSYAGYVVGLQAIVRHQAQQIADLTERLERLEKAEPHEAGGEQDRRAADPV